MRKLILFLTIPMIAISCSKDNANSEIMSVEKNHSIGSPLNSVKIDFFESSFTIYFHEYGEYYLSNDNGLDLGPFNIDTSITGLHDNVIDVDNQTIDLMMAEHKVRVSNENFVSGNFVEYTIEKLDISGNPIENTAAKLIFSNSENFLYSGFPFLLNDDVEENGWPIVPILRGLAYLAAIAAAA